LISYQVKLKN